MGLTVADVERRQSVGTYYEKIVDITFDTSYPTGGEALVPADVGFDSILQVSVDPTAGFVFTYDYVAETLQAFWVDTTVDGAAMAEVPDTHNLSAVTARAVVRGR